MRLVEWEDLEIGVFNCAGELFAIEDRCSHDDGPLADGESTPGDLHGGVPAPRIALRPAYRQAQNLPAYQPVRTFPVGIQDDNITLEV